METLPRVLICDDDRIFHLAVRNSLKNICECKSAYNGDEALAIIKHNCIDLLLLDIQMRSPEEGLNFIPKLKDVDPELTIVMASSLTDFETVTKAMRLGAADYLKKEANNDELRHAIERILKHRLLQRRSTQQNYEVTTNQHKHILIGETPEMQMLKKSIERIAISKANVLITGETGTGKEVVARQLRRPLHDGTLAPFIAIDSSTIQSSRAESILFGHEKGAFTGAEKTTKGIFEEANGGIIYFDEIGNMPLEIQSKLLRVLQEKEVTRLGSNKVLSLDFRVVCASNKDLESMASTGHFKYDLLQRLNVLPIQLPALREKQSDIPLLLNHFIRKHSSSEMFFTPDAIQVLSSYAWPGNVRELSNVVAYLSTMVDGADIDVADLPPRIRACSTAALHKTSQSTENCSFYNRISSFERDLLAKEYEKHHGNISKMALALEMDRSHLHTKLKEYGLHISKQKSSL